MSKQVKREHLVKDIDNKRGCPFTELQCSNGCGVVMQRRLVEGHLKSECELRKVKCEYCNTTGSYQWINSSHHKECPKYPVECPNHCEVGHVRREEIRGLGLGLGLLPSTRLIERLPFGMFEFCGQAAVAFCSTPIGNILSCC